MNGGVSPFDVIILFGTVGDTPKHFPHTKGDCTVKTTHNAQVLLSTTLVISSAVFSSVGTANDKYNALIHSY